MNYRHLNTGRTFLFAITLLGVCGSAAPARAYQVFVRAGIAGDATAAGYVGQINALAFSWNVQQTPVVSSTGISSSKAMFTPFTITKTLDRASIPLALAAASGQILTLVTVTVVNNGLQPIAIFNLSNVLVTSASQAAAASPEDSGVGEEVAFSFSKIVVTYYIYDERGRVIGTVVRGWDVAGNRAA